MNEPLNDSTYLDMVEIPAGKFLMGSSPEEEDRFSDEGPQHEVELEGFFMSRTPITQAQWREVAGFPKVNQHLDPDPSFFKGDDRPVEQVSWLEAMEFCARLSQHSGRNYILPSESQWEYACRAGTTTRFSTGDTITTDQANFDGTYVPVDSDQGVGDYRGETTPVGMFPANAWGMQDMHGNVWEWCLDHWHQSYEGAPTDGSAWVEDDILGKSCAAALGATSSPVSAARLTAPGTPRTTAVTTVDSASAAEDDSLGKSSEGEPGISRSASSDPPHDGEISQVSDGKHLVSASLAEANSLGKSSEGARGTSTPGSAARLAATGAPRTTATASSASASVAEYDSPKKSCAVAPGSTNLTSAARPAGSATARPAATTTLASASAYSLKLLRGGSWFNFPHDCRSAYRACGHPSCPVADRDGRVGFRVCCLYKTVLP
jgi:formylglycine-generating enzyme required for sulfatase activity